jgi:hypothetical protein
MDCIEYRKPKSQAAAAESAADTYPSGRCGGTFKVINRCLSVRKVVPTLTSKSAEIYLSMAGAKQLVTRGLSWFRPGPYVQQ